MKVELWRGPGPREIEIVDVPDSTLNAWVMFNSDKRDPLNQLTSICVRNNNIVARVTIESSDGTSEFSRALAALFKVVLSKSKEFG